MAEQDHDPAGGTEADELELEVRQIPGVCFVAFRDAEATTVVEVGVEHGADGERVRAEVFRRATSQFEGDVTVELVDAVDLTTPRSETRVQLLVTLAAPGHDEVEIHLAHRGRRAAARAASRDRIDIATAVIAALGDLGFPTPFVPIAAHALSADLGSGTLVILSDVATGESRRGLASGSTDADATARAVLSALNRFLQPSAPDRV